MKLFAPKPYYTAPLPLACMAASLDVAFKMRRNSPANRARARNLIVKFRAMVSV